MGNQGTKNWKLTAFFAISLMLIAGLFSNAAIAGNGDGTITVGWSDEATTDDPPINSYDTTPDGATTTTDITPPLPAGSRGNSLKFTYTVPITTSMAGGMLQILIPAGWTQPKIAVDVAGTPVDEKTLYQNVTITSKGATLYDTDGTAQDADFIALTVAQKASLVASYGSVLIDDAKIEVTLGSNWFNGGVLVITLGNVQTDIPSSLRVAATGVDVEAVGYYPAYTAYTFEARSMERNGRLVRLRPSTDNPSPQPRVRVGNILGTRLVDSLDTFVDTTSREVAVTPATSYPGEEHDYIVTFTAPGPMYGHVLEVTLPEDARLNLLPEGTTVADQISVRAPGALVAFDAAMETALTADADTVVYGITGRVVTIGLTRINKGQKVTVTLRDATVAAPTATAPDGSEFAVTTRPAPDFTDTPPAVTKRTGGAFALLPGSGTLAVSPDSAKANAVVSRITLTYTASTSLMNAQLQITVPEGIMASAKTGEADLDDDDATLEPIFRLMRDPKKKGYISSPDSKGAEPDIGYSTEGTSRHDLEEGTPTTITWNSVTLAKDKTFRTYITGVRVQDDGGTLPFTAQVTQGTAALAALSDANVADARFYVIVTENEDVTFEAAADKHFLRAASLQTVVFTFTADDTPIRNGRVQFSIPSGWSAPMKPAKDDADVIGMVKVGGTAVPALRYKEDLAVSSRSITVTVPNMARGETVTVTYGASAKQAMIQTRATVPDKPLKINGYYWASSSSPRRGAGTVEIEVGNANDGTGKGTITPTTVRAGSIDETFTIKYVAAGTMDGGQISLERPTDWGDFDTDPSKLNYVRVSASRGASIEETDNGGSIIIVTLDKCPPNGTITFVYGTGTGAQRGARAQDATGVVPFTIKSQGDDFGTLLEVMGDQAKAAVEADDPMYLGETFTDAVGMLRVNVTGADDGRGTGEVTLVASKAGDGAYTDEQGVALTVAEMRVHAADDATYIKIVYTATETIENGALKFTVPTGWSKPQGSDPGEVGFTSVLGAESESYADAATDLSLEVPIILMNAGETIEIHYGETAGSGGGAVAPAASGKYRFTIETKGGDADANVFKAIRGTDDGDPLEIRVYSQASGGGSAEVTAGDDGLTAGGEGQITVVYTAAGDISSGMLKLTTPANWSHPLMSNVAITSTGSVGSASAMDFGGYYVGDPDDATDDKTVPTGGPGAMDVLVDSVRLNAGDKVTFVFSAAMVQAAMGDATFAVTLDGGAGPGMTAAAVSPPEGGTLTVSVGEAAAGSGTSGVDLMGMAVVAGSMANELTFTYTAIGTIGYPREFRVSIPAGWSEPNDEDKGTYTVALVNKDGRARANVVEALAAVDRDLVARVRAGSATVNAGDVVSITYTNADAPRTVGASMFEVLFDDVQVGDNVTVLVGSGKDATMLMVDASPAMILAEGDESVAVTVMVQDEDGSEVPATADLPVSLRSATGSFMVDGAAATMVTIMAGTSSATVSYTNSTLGEATITASSGTLTAGTATVTVTTDIVEITSATVTPTVAKAGDTVTVSAMGTSGKTATFSVGAIVTDGAMTEDESGSYSSSFDVVADLHADGDYDVTVNLNGQSTTLTAALTIDSTAPTVTVSDIEGTVANGDAVMISAMVEEAGSVASVMADVSMLDSTQGMVALTMADGAYSADVMISEDNAAMNGAQTITVTAMDAAGNSGMGSTTVELLNTLSFTSMIPAGISLFHVPLDVDGLDTVGDLETMLGNSVNLLITYDGTSWNSRSDDVMITATLGILVSLSAETTVTFEGNAWADGSISLAAGSNLIGLPLNDPDVTMISDIMGIFDEGVVSSIIVSSGGEFKLVAAAGDAADGPVAGDAAYLVVVTAAGSAMLSGDGWMNGEMAGAAPIALAGYTVDNQTPVLDLLGSVVDEITGLAKEGFRVKAKNLSTKAALSNVTSVEATDGYNMTFVDLADSYAARVGDVLEISADSPDPLLGIKPVRHIVTVDDVKNSRIQLEDLIAYEIPAETELLRNYPNPFNPETWIPYRLAEDADVSLTIYDTSGALVRSIDIGHQTAAVYETRAKAIYWDGRNRFGEQVASGIYFYSLSTGDFSATRKMVILK